MQFVDVVPFAEEMANAGKVVVVAALDGTFLRQPFGSILELVPIAEEVTKLTAVCMQCFGPGAFSKRLGSETEVELIGGADKYIAVCRQCFISGPPTKVHEDAPAAAAAATPAVTPAPLDTAASLKIISVGTAGSPTSMSVGMSSGRAL